MDNNSSLRKVVAIPLVQVGGIRFGESRATVRKQFGEYREYRKSRFSKNTTDDFGFCHVYYDVNDHVEAFEIFRGTEVVVNGKVVFPGSISAIEKETGEFQKDDGGWINKRMSIGIYAPENEMEGILFGRKGYYDQV